MTQLPENRSILKHFPDLYYPEMTQFLVGTAHALDKLSSESVEKKKEEIKLKFFPRRADKKKNKQGEKK